MSPETPSWRRYRKVFWLLAVGALLFLLHPYGHDRWGEIDSEAGSLAPRVSLLAARLRPLDIIHAREADRPLAVGSAFKLYLLDALGRAVIDGTVSYGDTLVLGGDPITVEECAMLLIRDSDNEAADALIDLLGRETVEAVIIETGHSAPGLIIPLMTTREALILKTRTPEDELERFFSLPPAGRREYLSTLEPSAVEIPWDGPLRLDVEWHASLLDLASLAEDLSSIGEDPASGPLLEIMGSGSAPPREEGRWDYIAYKGGYEPGVINMTVITRARDEWFFFGMTLNDTEEEVDWDPAAEIFIEMMDLVPGIS